jgi:hypothetical protein
MIKQAKSSVKKLFEDFRGELANSESTRSSSHDAETIAAALLTVATVIKQSPAGLGDLLQATIEMAPGKPRRPSPEFPE